MVTFKNVHACVVGKTGYKEFKEYFKKAFDSFSKKIPIRTILKSEVIFNLSKEDFINQDFKKYDITIFRNLATIPMVPQRRLVRNFMIKYGSKNLMSAKKQKIIITDLVCLVFFLFLFLFYLNLIIIRVFQSLLFSNISFHATLDMFLFQDLLIQKILRKNQKFSTSLFLLVIIVIQKTLHS